MATINTKVAPPVGTIISKAGAGASNNTSYAGVVAPGQTLPLSMTGTNFYLSVATAPLYVRTSGQSWSLYQPGTGANVGAFQLIELYNSGASAITFQINVGTGQFIDHRAVTPLVPFSVIVPPVWGPYFGGSYSTALADKAGLPITDIAGNSYIAVQRILASFQTGVNPAGNSVIFVSGEGSSFQVCIVQSIDTPGGSISGPVTVASQTGDLFVTMNVPSGGGDGSVWGFVYELYLAVLPGSGLQGIPPG
jgi:hypothetical protein